MAQTGTPRHDQLLEVAALLFRSRGYEEVGVDDIGAAAGVTGPAVYRHFSGKQALLVEVVGSYLAALETESRVLDASGQDHDHILHAAVTVGTRFPNRLVTLLHEAKSLEPQGRAHVATIREPVEERWDAFLTAHGIVARSPSGDLLRCAASGVLLHLSLTRTGTKTLRSRLSERLVLALLNVPLSPVGRHLQPLVADPIQHVTRREALFTAATELFCRDGYNRVSLRDIGAAVGLSASGVSRHFDSKDQLMVLIRERAMAQISASISAALRTSSTGEEAARSIGKRYAAIALDFRDLISITSTQMYSLGEPHRLSRLRNQRMYVDELANTLRLARPELSAAECRLRAGAAYSAVNEVALHPTLWRRGGIVDALTDLVDSILFSD